MVAIPTRSADGVTGKHLTQKISVLSGKGMVKTMTKAKRNALLEVVAEILSRVHGDLCRDRKFELATDVDEIMRLLYLLSKKL